jgi:hypothetical protein
MNPYLELDRLLLGDIYTSSEAMDNLAVLCDDFGSRTPGTPQERAAAEFLLEKLTHYGCANTRLEPYPYNAWERGDASLRVVEPCVAEIPCIALPYCPAAEVTARLTLLENGGPASFEAHAEAIRGAVVGVSSRPPAGLERIVHRQEMYRRSALGGAAAFVFIGMYEGRGPETGSLDDDREGLIPGISIGHEDAEFLRRQQHRRGALTVRIRTSGRTYPATSWNVVGELPGPRDELVLLGCHYDGHDIAQGAHDPASGTVSVVEAARVLSRYASGNLGCTVRFVLFGTEEIGLTGAERYTTMHRDELDRVRFLLNCDAAGGGGEKGIELNAWPEVEPVFEEFGRQMGGLPLGQKTHAFSDHYPFFLCGVPTGYIGNPRGVFTGRGWGHTRYDTLDKVQADDVRRASALAARIVLRIANAQEWPARRRSREAVERLIASEPNLNDIRPVAEAYDALYARRRGATAMPNAAGSA